MREIYRLILENRELSDCILVSGADKSVCGEKLLLCGTKILYATPGAGRWKKEVDRFLQIPGKETCEIAGSTVFAERLSANARVIVCGGGTVGQEVVKLGKLLGYTVIVIEDRMEYAMLAEKLGADQVYCVDFSSGLAALGQGDADYYVVMTREHRYDKDCLEAILRRRYAYVGMMASRTRAGALKEVLRLEGFAADKLESLRSPIGLNIHAETPAEIAVSIYAEIIEHRNQNDRSEGFREELLKVILACAPQKPMILVTIVERTGSAPRDIGTKMLIHEDGTKSGSVGGGWMEAEVTEMALDMFRTGQRYMVYQTEEDSENAVLCGGYETICLEMI